jgi:hypothetical protein
MSIKITLSLAAAFVAAAAAFALAQGEARERLRRNIETESCEAAALASAQALAANLARCQSRALALVRLDEARGADVLAMDDQEPTESAFAMQGSALARMTPGERAHALAQRCAVLRLRCDEP